MSAVSPRMGGIRLKDFLLRFFRNRRGFNPIELAVIATIILIAALELWGKDGSDFETLYDMIGKGLD